MKNSKRDKKKGALVVALALIVALAVPTGDLCAKTRSRGAEVVVQRMDGTFLAGELLAVQGKTLVVSDRVSARDVTVGIEDVRAIRIVRHSKVLKKAALGFLYAGVPVGALGLAGGGGGGITNRIPAIALFGAAGALYAGLRAVAKGADETAVLGGAPGTRADSALKKLGSMALFRGALPANFDGVGRQPKLGAPLAANQGRFEDLMAPRLPRFHLSFEPALYTSRETAPSTHLFQNMGFGDTHPGGSVFFFDYGPTTYPRATGGSGISLRGFTAEYSLNRSFVVGFAYASLGKVAVEGFRMIPVTWRGESYYTELYASAASAGDGYFITAAWRPTPDIFFNRYAFKLGVELGLCAARMTFGTSEYAFGTDVDKRSVTKAVPAAGIVAGLDSYYGRNMSLGVWARYRYASARVGTFGLNGSYISLDEQANPIDVPITVAFPAHRINLGGPAAGVSLGLHF
jgi:hypothetical protein